ncbi:MAG: hypothetical protein ACR2LT_08715 [Pyrinomonadaceae bacterium]
MVTKIFYIFFFAFVLLASQSTFGQGQNTSDNQKSSGEKVDSRIDNLKKQASELLAALDKHDFGQFVELPHPTVPEKVGGRATLISIVKSVAEQTPKIFETFSTSVGNPGALVEADGQLFGVVPQIIAGTTYEKHKIVIDSCIVGVSDDKGKTWKFVSGGKFDEIFPSLKGKLQIVTKKTFIDGVEQ